MAVVTLKTDGEDCVGNARMFGSPEDIVSVAVYLLTRVRADALKNLNDGFAADCAARVDAALMALGATVELRPQEAVH